MGRNAGSRLIVLIGLYSSILFPHMKQVYNMKDGGERYIKPYCKRNATKYPR
jgi:hypothetical protein